MRRRIATESTGSPRMRAEPAVGRMRFIRSFRVVVFPAPFGPRKPTTSPRATSSDRPSRARTLRFRQKPTSKSLVRFSISITAIDVIFTMANILNKAKGKSKKAKVKRIVACLFPFSFFLLPYAPPMLKIGIDTGGTFTDFLVLDGRKVRALKLLSTPENPARAILAGLERLVPRGECEIFHGSTVATNALLEARGARTALVTTRGFEDVIEIGRQNRPRIYSLYPSRPAPLVPRRLRFGVTERMLYDGSVLIPLAKDDLPALVETLRRARVESIAVCLLFSFANPSHERAAGRALRRLALPISLSHEILPEFREYERTSTTVVNAYLAPLVGRYLAALERGVSRAGRRARLCVMQSNGGSVSARLAARQPVRTILSGPAGGVVGAWHVAAAAGYRDLITFDMGGTSTDVALVAGEIRVTTESVIAHRPIGVPVIDIHTVGAGGGSIARVDPGGALRVGPESAGADPGPICYGRGTRITVTDANLFVGKLDAGYPLGGTLRLQPTRLDQAFRRLARELGTK